MSLRTEREIAERNAAITRAVNKGSSRQAAQNRAGPCTILKGDNLFTVHFTRAGKPTADSQRLLDVLGAAQ